MRVGPGRRLSLILVWLGAKTNDQFMICTLPVPKRTPSIPQLGEDPLACILTANRVIAVAPPSGTAAPCGTMHKWTSLLPDSGTDQLLATVAFLF